MFKKSMLAIVIASSVFVSTDSFAAFGGSRASSSGVGVQRSAPVSKPTYTAPRSTSSRAYNSQPRTQVVEKHYYNDRNSYSNGNNNSFGSQVASTALGVGAGILAAEAIQGLIAGPQGTYTHPQHPGVYYNQQGVPVEAPAVPAQMQPQASPVIVQQAQQKEGGFFNFLWGMLGNVLHLGLFLGVVGGLVWGAMKIFKMIKSNKAEDDTEERLNILADDIDVQAMDLFYDFQRNANDTLFIEMNTKYMNPGDVVSPACKVISYQHEVKGVSVEAGKYRADVHYKATVREVENTFAQDEKVNQLWTYERNLAGKWLLVGITPVN